MTSYRVLYAKNPQFFNPPTRTMAELEETHAEVIVIAAENVEQVFTQMQAHNWRPNEADIAKLRAADVHHASMSVDDIVIDLDTGEGLQVADFGWNPVS